ncbi:MAG: SpoVA/SpoVAEb family sporulation membrane protein [Ruminococcus sp.]|nr:SpoVA/SpoVAEb family sporulation membrane protein [Ruminococcus sp.]
MHITPQMYGEMSRQASPKSNSAVNTAFAFVSGGAVCAVGQIIREFFMTAGFSDDNSAMWTSIILIFASAVLTGTGLYQKLAKHAGAGTLVPITGFSNAISSSAIEAQSEGYILGVGTKIFTIAGPVILYGSAASVIYGILYYIVT